MNPRLILLSFAILGAHRVSAVDVKPAPAAPPPAKAAVGVAKAPTASSVAPTGTYDAFRIVTDRNIFNPNRTGRRDRSVDEVPPRLDIITLVGTMDSDKGLRAFCDGSDAAYRKALRVGDSVDKFKVTKISANTVDFEADGKSFSARVGQQFHRPEGADWTLVGEDVARLEAQARAAAANAGRVNPNAPVAIPADASDAVRKMMERRNQTLKP
jgi:hypothetical protein